MKKKESKKKAVYKWAREDGLDEDLFAKWRNEMVSEKQYQEYKKIVNGGN